MSSVVLLTRRPKLLAAAADWKFPGVEVYLLDTPAEALARLSLGQSDVFLFDSRDYPRYKHVIRKFLSMNTDTDLVVVGQDDILAEVARIDHQAAVSALPADTQPDEIAQTVESKLRLRRVREQSGIVGRSRAVAEMMAMIAQAAPLDVNILLQGESGTGKELAARAIHDHSQRADGPFISLNSGAMSEGVLESELFGHARGAFTGAVSDHEGVFKRANKGTLFLDEVAEMPLGMQTRFLRALESGEFTAVGGRKSERSDIRLIAATHRDLAVEVAEGRFRQDLYYRLKVVVITMPPLRQRREDIPLLVHSFLEEENHRHGLHVKGLTRAAEKALMEYDWPGNVRELKNTISSVVVMKQNGLIDLEDLPREFRFGPVEPDSSFLPVPMDRHSGGNLDLGVLASTLLELRQEIREIKAFLQGAPDGSLSVTPDGRIPSGNGYVETFDAEDSYSPLQGDQVGDLQIAERSLIQSALQATGGNRRKAAERLGISERTLYRKIKNYGI